MFNIGAIILFIFFTCYLILSKDFYWLKIKVLFWYIIYLSFLCYILLQITNFTEVTFLWKTNFTNLIIYENLKNFSFLLIFVLFLNYIMPINFIILLNIIIFFIFYNYPIEKFFIFSLIIYLIQFLITKYYILYKTIKVLFFKVNSKNKLFLILLFIFRLK